MAHLGGSFKHTTASLHLYSYQKLHPFIKPFHQIKYREYQKRCGEITRCMNYVIRQTAYNPGKDFLNIRRFHKHKCLPWGIQRTEKQTEKRAYQRTAYLQLFLRHISRQQKHAQKAKRKYVAIRHKPKPAEEHRLKPYINRYRENRLGTVAKRINDRQHCYGMNIRRPLKGKVACKHKRAQHCKHGKLTHAQP